MPGFLKVVARPKKEVLEERPVPRTTELDHLHTRQSGTSPAADAGHSATVSTSSEFSLPPLHADLKKLLHKVRVACPMGLTMQPQSCASPLSPGSLCSSRFRALSPRARSGYSPPCKFLRTQAALLHTHSTRVSEHAASSPRRSPGTRSHRG